MGHPRKTTAAIAAGIAGVLGMAGVAAAAHGNNSPAPAHLERHSGLDDATSTTIGGATSTSEPEHARPEPGDDNGVDATTGASGASGASGATGASGASGAGEAEPGDDNGHDGANDENESEHHNGDDTSTTIPGDTSTTLARIPNGMQTFTVAGGSVTVDVEDGVLSLVSVTPNAGVDVKDQRAGSNEVRVEFRGPDGDSRVRVRIHEGRFEVETGDN